MVVVGMLGEDHLLPLTPVPFSYVARVACSTLVVWGSKSTVGVRDDVGYIHLGDGGIVKVAHLTKTTSAELTAVSVTLQDCFFIVSALFVPGPASYWHICPPPDTIPLLLSTDMG